MSYTKRFTLLSHCLVCLLVSTMKSWKLTSTEQLLISTTIIKITSLKKQKNIYITCSFMSFISGQIEFKINECGVTLTFIVFVWSAFIHHNEWSHSDQKSAVRGELLKLPLIILVHVGPWLSLFWSEIHFKNQTKTNKRQHFCFWGVTGWTDWVQVRWRLHGGRVGSLHRKQRRKQRNFALEGFRLKTHSERFKHLESKLKSAIKCMWWHYIQTSGLSIRTWSRQPVGSRGLPPRPVKKMCP